MESRIRIRKVRTLSDDWYVLKKTTFDFQRHDGTWQTVNRETYDRGNGVAVLLYNRKKGTVLLTRQFRYPAYVNGCSDGLRHAAVPELRTAVLPVERVFPTVCPCPWRLQHQHNQSVRLDRFLQHLQLHDHHYQLATQH